MEPSDREKIDELVELIKTLHIVARDTVTDDDLIAALAFFRPRGMFTRGVPAFEDAAAYYLLKAFQKFRA